MAIFRQCRLEVEAIRFTGDNMGELVVFCGVRNVETKANPHWISVFNFLGTYLPNFDYPYAEAEVWVEEDERHRPVYTGNWIAKVEGHEGVRVLPDDGTGLAPLHHESITSASREESLDHRILRTLALHGGHWMWDGKQDEMGPVLCACNQWRGSIAAHREHMRDELMKVVELNYRRDNRDDSHS